MTLGDAACRWPNCKVLEIASGRWNLLFPAALVESQHHEFGESVRHRAHKWKPQKSCWHGMLLSRRRPLPASLARQERGRESLSQVLQETQRTVLPQSSSDADQAHLHRMFPSREPLQPPVVDLVNLYGWQVLYPRGNQSWTQLYPVSCNHFSRR